MTTSTPVAWADKGYLRDIQYRDSSKLAARASLHEKYGRDDWMPWIAAQRTWRAGEAVLEVGCGAGWFWEKAAGALPPDLAITLCDLSPGMVAEATARARAAERGWRIEGQAADAMTLPFADASFDVVMACHMLYHLPSPGQGVAEIARVLRPGGTALIATNGKGNMAELFAPRQAVFGGDAGDWASQLFSLESAPALIDPHFAGFELRRYDDDLVCTDPADIHAYLTSSPPGDAGSPEDDDALRRAIGEAFEAGGGVLKIHKNVGLFVCRKAG